MEGKTTHTTYIMHIVNSKTEYETGTFSKKKYSIRNGRQEKEFFKKIWRVNMETEKVTLKTANRIDIKTNRDYTTSQASKLRIKEK